jgi:hypothetical protein
MPNRRTSVKEMAAKGGKARAEALSSERRSEIAREAVLVRWAQQGTTLRATHGSPDRPLRIGDIAIPCYVLEDGMRVLSGRGMQSALSLGQGHGALLKEFLTKSNLKPFISNELAMVLANPIRFVRPGRGGILAAGYEATILADICDLVLAARKAAVLSKHQLIIADQCEILARAFARVGIIALVDEATGFQDARARDALAKILEAFIAKELRKWVSTFPADFYKEMFRLRQIPYTGDVKRPAYIGHLTNDLVYARLAPGVLDELKVRNPVTSSGHRKAKHFQWLTEEIGHPKLLQHLYSVTTLMRAFDKWNEFKDRLDKALPKHRALDFHNTEDENRSR